MSEPAYTLEQWQDWLGRLTKLIAHGGAEGDKGKVECEYEPGKWRTFRVPPQSPVWAFSDAMEIAKDKLEDAGIYSPGGDKLGQLLVLLSQSAFILATLGTVAPAALPALRSQGKVLLKALKSAGIDTPDLVDITVSGVGGSPMVDILKQILAFFLKNPSELIVKAVKFVAEGGFEKLGIKGPQKVYLALQGKKTYIGLGFGIVYGALAQLCGSAVSLPFDSCYWADWAIKISVVMVSIGLLVHAVDATPPAK